MHIVFTGTVILVIYNVTVEAFSDVIIGKVIL